MKLLKNIKMEPHHGIEPHFPDYKTGVIPIYEQGLVDRWRIGLQFLGCKPRVLPLN